MKKELELISGSSGILPKVVFEQIPIELETEMFLGFLKKDWSFKITDKYPQFLKIKEIKFERERKEAIKNEILKIRQELGQEMDGSLLKLKSDWQKVGEKTLQILSEIIQTDYSKKEITAYISINPICPRFLDSWSFSVTNDHKQPKMVITHEISHFLYFKKFKELFPEINRDKYESPHKEWVLSEIIAVTILNDQRIKDILKKGNSNYYPQHKELRVDGEPLIGKIEKLYNEFVILKKDFSEFISRGIDLLKDLNLN